MPTPLEIATAYYDAGLFVLPAKLGGKAPIVPWKEWQNGFPREKLEEWYKDAKKCNYWLICGSASHVVPIDCDGEPAQAWWRKLLGPILEQTTTAKTARGWHYLFALPEGVVVPSWSMHENGVEFDVRSDGGGVIVPPSVHQSGHVYRWIRDLSFLQPLPIEAQGRAGSAGEARVEEGKQRSRLADLLGNLPDAGGRNEWLARVAGHYAKIIKFRDAYDLQVRLAVDQLPEPLEEAEVTKTADSIWESEHSKTLRDNFGEDNGYLIGDGSRIYTQVKIKDEGIDVRPWSNFDAVCQGVIVDDSGLCAYDVTLHREGHTPTKTLLAGKDFGSYVTMTSRLAACGAGILVPNGDIHRGNPIERLRRYIDGQDPPKHEAAEYLGWHDGEGFICHEGVITADGLHAHSRVVPHPRLVNWAPYKYGFSEEEIARAVLREILTFHYEIPVAVFASWWAALFIKPQITKLTALFPFMVLEAPSEAGKTHGFFAMLMQLSGYNGGQGEYTPAAMRDMASAHNNGLLWVDDITTAAGGIWDIMRQSTGGGARTKKGVDNTTQETVRMVAPIALSGEGFDELRREKALWDRAIVVEVKSPIDRMSLRDPSRPQWDDIVDLMNKWHGDLTQHAGTLVQMALQRVGLANEVRNLRPGTGRFADKMAILRVGARMLSQLAGEEKWIEIVDNWVLQQVDTKQENILTKQILPEALIAFGVPRTPGNGVPVYVTDDRLVRWNEPVLAIWWAQGRRTPRQLQLGSLESLRQQRQALDIEGKGRRVRVQGSSSNNGSVRQARFHELPREMSMEVVERTGSVIPAVTVGAVIDDVTGVSRADNLNSSDTGVTWE